MKIDDLLAILQEAKDDIGNAEVYVNFGGLGDEEVPSVRWFPYQEPAPHVEIGVFDDY